MSEDKGSHFLEGMLVGGLMGAALGVIVAPFMGEKAQETIKAKLKEFELDDLIDRFVLAFEEGKKEADRAAKELEEK